MAQIIVAESAAPSTPSAGNVAIYAKADGIIYYKDDAGTETQVGAGVQTATTKLPQIAVTQATGALTIAGIAKYLDFRSATLTSGTPSTVLADPADLVVPSGATLGSVTTVSARIIVAEMNNAGTSEYAVTNISGGLQVDETNLISTTAISTGADSANVWYSTTARTNLPYRIVAAFDAVNTAGAWGDPTLVQPAGGQAITAMSSLGYGQTWQSSARTSGVTYYSGSKPIDVSAYAVRTTVNGNVSVKLTIGGRSIFDGLYVGAAGGNNYVSINGTVPPFTAYIITVSGQDSYVVEELR